LPGLAWDATLKITGVTLDLLTDVNMLLMFKNGIRGGVATASNRLGQANYRYMGEGYDSSKPSKYILRCKQPLWLGYVETITYTWIQVDE